MNSVGYGLIILGHYLNTSPYILGPYRFAEPINCLTMSETGANVSKTAVFITRAISQAKSNLVVSRLRLAVELYGLFIISLINRLLGLLCQVCCLFTRSLTVGLSSGCQSIFRVLINPLRIAVINTVPSPAARPLVNQNATAIS
jgi:hypothetical protein